jgi:hypothetical protein
VTALKERNGVLEEVVQSKDLQIQFMEKDAVRRLANPMADAC